MTINLRRLPPLDPLKGFVAAAHHASFTKAGETLFLTQSAISRQVQALESQLGVPLFRRSTRQLQLTPAGDILYRAALAAFAELDDAVRLIAAPRRPAGVTVSTSIGFAALWLVPRLSCFQEAHPDIAVRLSADNRAVDLARDEIDLAIRYCAPGEAPAGSRKLFDEALLPVVGPGLRGQLPTATSLDRASLGQLTLLAFQDAIAHPWFAWNTWLQPLGLDASQARGHLQFNHYDQCIAAALAGQGVALGREPLIRDHLTDGRLIALAPPRPVPERAYYLLAGATADEPAVAAFTAWLLGQTDASPKD
jgi:LysR family transcriptional regulator, glycine cleavage system transcriptional activator